MGGSSGGGGYSSGGGLEEGRAMQSQRFNLLAAEKLGRDIEGIAGSQDVLNLASANLTPAELAQVQAIDVGQQRATQVIQQNVREQASARGLYSSAGAIGQEAAGLANLDVMRSQSIADIYGNAQQRQFQGINLRSGLLGQGAGLYQANAGGFANQTSGYQNATQIANQGMQLQNQYQQQQQNLLRQNVMGGAALIAAPFTGGASLGYFAGGR